MTDQQHQDRALTYDVCGIGNALLDIEFNVSVDFLRRHHIDKGVMNLVDEDRQHYLFSHLGETHIHKVASGGSAANTMVALQHFGGAGFYICKIAADETGDRYCHDMSHAGLRSQYDRQKRQVGLTGKCLVMVTPDADRTMNTFLGVSDQLNRADLDLQAIRESQYLYVEGYLMASPIACEAAVLAKQYAREHGVKVALTLSDPFVVEHHFEAFQTFFGDDGVDLLFCNERELYAYTGSVDLESGVEQLKRVAKTFAVTQGPEGSCVFDGQQVVHIPAERVCAVDTLGAGDMYAGAFLYGVTNGLSYRASGELASRTAGKVVTQYGPRLRRDQIQTILNSVVEQEAIPA